MSFIEQMISEIKQHADQKYKSDAGKYFKEGITLHGVRLPIVRKIARKYWKMLPAIDAKRPHIKDKKEVFRLCEQLLKNDKQETHTVAFQWAYAVRKQYAKKDFDIFERWIKKYVNNWAKCDDLCGGALDYFLYEFSEFLPRVFSWTKSSNRWLKRAAAVSLIYSLRKEKYLKEAFKTADALLMDKDDLVQKGYGWMLKEASNRHQKEIFDYGMKHKHKMPRTALRYAIEKMPLTLKKKAMA